MTARVIRTPFVGELAEKNPGYKEGFIVFGDTKEEVAEALANIEGDGWQSEIVELFDPDMTEIIGWRAVGQLKE